MADFIEKEYGSDVAAGMRGETQAVPVDALRHVRCGLSAPKNSTYFSISYEMMKMLTCAARARRTTIDLMLEDIIWTQIMESGDVAERSGGGWSVRCSAVTHSGWRCLNSAHDGTTCTIHHPRDARGRLIATSED